MQSKNEYRLYPYRWVALAVFMFANLMVQLLWVSYNPITKDAAAFYKVSDDQISQLAESFMVVFVILSIPISWVIDKFGFRKAVGFGTILMGAFGVARGLVGHNYALTMVCTIGIGVGQPFLMNSWTTLPARWFEKEFRATAVGLVTLSSLVGIALGMVITPELAKTISIDRIQLIYGAISLLSSVIFIIFSRDNPPTPPSEDSMQTRALVLDGLKSLVKNKMFWLLVFVQFLGMAIFNGLTTRIEPIFRARNILSDQAGNIGALLVVGGIIGAVVLPALSDRTKKRKLFLFIGVTLSIPFLVGLVFAQSYYLLLACSFGLGFFLVSAGPIAMQFATEITFPIPEGTSNGLFQLFGQVSVIYVSLMDVMKTSSTPPSFTPSLLLAVFLLVVCVGVITFLRDPDFSAIHAHADSTVEQ